MKSPMLVRYKGFQTVLCFLLKYLAQDKR